MSVFADVNIVDNNNAQINNVTFIADYNHFDDDHNDVINETVTLNILNTEALDRSVQVLVNGLPAAYRASVQNPITARANNQSTTATLTISIPDDNDAGKLKIATIQVKDAQTGAVLDEADLVQDTKNMLNLDELRIEYTSDNDKRENEDACDQDKFCDETVADDSYSLDENVKVGTPFHLTFKIENLFDQDYNDGDLENVQISIEADDSDLYGDDFDEEFDVEEIGADEKRTYDMEFTIDPAATEDTYTLKIKIEAEDGNSAKFTLERSVEFEVKREKNDVRIQRAVLQPTTISSCQPDYHLDVEIQNYGSRKQNFAGLKIQSAGLHIDQEQKNIELDAFDDGEDTYEKSFLLSLPTGVKTGTYTIDAFAYISDSTLGEQKRFELNVESCTTEEQATTTQNTTQASSRNATVTQVTTSTLPPTQPSTTQTTQPAPTTGTTGTSYQVPQTIEEPYTVEDLFVAGIVIAVVLIVTLIVVFFVLLLRRQ